MPENIPTLTVGELKSPDSANSRAFAALLVVKKLAGKTASNGNPFLSVDLGDRTGSFGCTVFSDNPGFDALKAAGEGAVVRVEGKVDHYQGRLSPKLARGAARDGAGGVRRDRRGVSFRAGGGGDAPRLPARAAGAHGPHGARGY